MSVEIRAFNKGQAMVMVTSEIPAIWWWAVAMAWTFAAVFMTFKGGWLDTPERSDSFPFSARQFFFMTISLCLAFSSYIYSFIFANSVISSFRKLSLSSSLGSFTEHEWIGLTQVVGLIFGTLVVYLVSALLPSDLNSFVSGKNQELKTWFKGAAYGLLFIPVIFLTTWITGVISSLVSSEEKAPQIALDILGHLPHMGLVFWVLLPIIVFIVPYVEEMLFRGFLQGFLNGLVHPTLSIVLTSAAFSFFHYSPVQKGSNFEIMFGLFVFSFFASKLRIKENSINASIGMHAAFNALSLFIFFRTS